MPGRVEGVAVWLMLLGVGCTLNIGTHPDAYPFPSEQVFDVRAGTTLEIVNGHPEPRPTELARGVFADPQHMTDTARAIVARELARKGVDVSGGGAKRVVLTMTDLVWSRGFATQTAKLRLHAEFGDGDGVSVDGVYTTGGNAMRAFNGAILRATTALLEDQTFAAYLDR